jgi:hypothetical protein
LNIAVLLSEEIKMKHAKIILLAGFLLLLTAPVYGDPEWATFEIKVDGSLDAEPGDIVPVPIYLTRCDHDFGGFDLLLRFDPAVLSVDDVEQGQVLIDCGWEYFEYRRDDGPGLVRIIAIADTDIDPGEPVCYSGTGIIVVVHFAVDPGAVSRGFEPIEFLWNDCADNAFSSIANDTIFISDDVIDWHGSVVTGQPETGGALPDCMPGPPETIVARWIELTHGGITVSVPPPPDGCDPDGDGEAWTMADMIFLINYVFLGGPAPGPVELGDCDCNGVVNAFDISRSLCYMYRGCDDPCPGR